MAKAVLLELSESLSEIGLQEDWKLTIGNFFKEFCCKGCREMKCMSEDEVGTVPIGLGIFLLCMSLRLHFLLCITIESVPTLDCAFHDYAFLCSCILFFVPSA